MRTFVNKDVRTFVNRDVLSAEDVEREIGREVRGYFLDPKNSLVKVYTNNKVRHGVLEILYNLGFKEVSNSTH